MTIATATDVAARIGRPLTTLERGRVEAALQDIEVEIKRQAPDRLTLATWRDAVVSVECSAAIRVARLPDALTQLVPDIESAGFQSSLLTQGSVYLRRSERITLGLSNTASVAGAPNPLLETPTVPFLDDSICGVDW
jgi:hypothetical protein